METYPRPVNGTPRGAGPAAAVPVPGTPDPVPLSGPAVPPVLGGRETAGMQDLKTITKPITPAVPAPAAGAPVPESPETVPATSGPVPAAAKAGPRPWSVKAMRWVVWLSAVCAAVVAAIGFTGSYDALESLARAHGFGWYSWLFPVGIDAGIVAMYGLDLVLVWRRMPKPLLRLIAHGLTAATIVFNAASGDKPVLQDPLGALMHGVLPVLFVAVVEGVRHLIIRTNKLVLGVESDTVPLHRWVLSPWSAFTTYRRMKLRGITSYAQVVQMDKELDVYAAYLQHTHGRGWKKKAGATAMLPFTMAAYGLTVDEALDQPRLQQEAADRRARAEADRIAAARAAEEARLLDEEERKADNAIRRMAIDTKVTAAQHDTTAAKATAEAEAKAAAAAAVAAAGTAEHTAALTAEAERRAAERAAEAAEAAAAREAEAIKTAAEREAEACAAAALRAAEADRRAAAEAAAEAARKKAEAAATRAEAERLEAERRESVARQAEADRITAEALAATERARAEAARAEAAALEAEDTARLTPRERAERKVARLILAAHHALPADQRPASPDMYAVSLETVQEALGVSHTVAGQRRQAAADLIASGYAG
ncbi:MULTISPECIES: DUF2637 domain-containing protein [Streptomyces]|uniref:DUF2637 domain-containing protein n=2 Tax=Streptomyces TaxID=1883 RepID=A0ABU4KEU3_9ACTN|nr:DUF2637 domain-containing protein [Streptomyces roseolus]MDX2295877.1 DUF2637 domain-containing protein [Streptomyces roseolus]